MLAVIGLHSMLEYPLWYGPFQIAALLCVIILAAGIAPQAHPGFTKPGDVLTGRLQVLWRITSPLLAACGFAMLLWIGLDYFRITQIYLPEAERAEAYRSDTLNKVSDSRFFKSQVAFAELSLAELHRENAPELHAKAQKLLHYSPEPRVIEKLIESSVMMGRDDEALFFLVRYREAFPDDHTKWSRNQRSVSSLLEAAKETTPATAQCVPGSSQTCPHAFQARPRP